MGSTPSPPPSPSPYAVASAQSTADIETAISQAWLSNANISRPEADIVFTKFQDIVVPKTVFDNNGNVAGSINHNVPQFQAVVTLKPGELAIFNGNQTLRSDFITLGIQQIANVTTKLGVPVSFAGLPAFGTTMPAPVLNGTLTIPGGLVTSIGPSGSAAIQAGIATTQTAILTRLGIVTTIQFNNLVADLVNRGLSAGEEPYNQALDAWSRQLTDAQLQAWLTAQQEQTRAINAENQIGVFANAAQAQEFGQGAQVVAFGNQAQLQLYQALTTISSYINTVREQMRNEIMLLRRIEMDELNQLLHGGQPVIPQFAPFAAPHLQNSQLSQDVYNSAALDNQKYQFQTQQQSQLLGGILGAAGSILTAPGGGGGAGALGLLAL